MIGKNKEIIQINLEDLFSSKLRVKILKVLVDYKEINISSLVKGVNSNHSEVSKHVKCLAEKNIIEEKFFGRIHIIRFKNESLLGRILNDFFSFFSDRDCK